MMDIVASMVGHGFKKIFIQNSHGGNGSNISVLLQRLMERYGDSGAEFYSRWAWGGALDEIRELGSAGSGHAGETETCMIMAIDPSLVRTDRLDPDGERDGMRVPGMSPTTASISALGTVALAIHDPQPLKRGSGC